MKQIHVGCRIPPDWAEAIAHIKQATGQTDTEILHEALGLYLKKSKAVTVRSRLDEIEARLNRLAKLVVDG